LMAARWHFAHLLLILFCLAALETLAAAEQIGDSWALAAGR
jgi:hypothetical protein